MRSLAELGTLAGRRALITGATGHLGRVLSEALLELGVALAISDQSDEACRRQARELSERYGGNVIAAPCDLGDEAGTRAMVSRAVADLGGLTVYVHCAGFVGSTSYPGWAVPFASQSVEAWNQALAVNLTSAFVIAQQAAPALRESGSGSVVLISSIYGLVGPDMRLYEDTQMANPAAYGASKGGLLQLTRYLATVLAPSIRVNAISPGGLWRNQPVIFRERYESKTPLGRMGCEEDIKGAVAYLATDLSAYVTGQNLVVDGGWTAW